jgi:membrane protein implicated in regulation of membrane protease activity
MGYVKSNTAQKLWFLAALCFVIAGIVGKNTVFIVLGCAYICIGSSIKKKKTIDKDVDY